MIQRLPTGIEYPTKKKGLLPALKLKELELPLGAPRGQDDKVERAEIRARDPILKSVCERSLKKRGS